MRAGLQGAWLALVVTLPFATLVSEARAQARLVKDINVTPVAAPSSSPSGGHGCGEVLINENVGFVRVGSWFYFVATTPEEGTELYRTGGTTATTTLVADIWPGKDSSLPRYLTNINGKLFFSAFEPKTGYELYVHDPVSNKLTMLDLTSGETSSNPVCFVEFKGEAYFTYGYSTNDEQIWRSDGTASGTGKVVSIKAGLRTSVLPRLVYSKELYFLGDDGKTGVELWKTDGTANGTVQVADIFKGLGSSLPRYLTEFNGKLYFSAENGRYSNNGNELWVTDGTTAGTKMAVEINPGTGSSSPQHLVVMGDKLYFSAYHPNTGTELYEYDGKTSATLIDLFKLGASPSSKPEALTVAGAALYFSAIAQTSTGSGVGRELCRYDGNKVTVWDIRPQGWDSSPTHLAVAGGRLFFSANDGKNGTELFGLDVTKASAVPQIIKDIAPGIADSRPEWIAPLPGNRVLFAAEELQHGRELWVSDGTGSGTSMVVDLAQTENTVSSHPAMLVASANRLFFTANDGKTGVEPWVSDGTASGTRLIGDINPGGGQSWSDELTVVGNKLFFAATGVDPVRKEPVGRELWSFDIITGKLSVVDISKGASSSNPTFLTPFRGKVFFSATGDLNESSPHGTEMWRSDGTAKGTRRVTDINPGSGGSFPVFITPHKGALYFRARDPKSGDELWKTDGTTAGTKLVVDVRSGSGSSFPAYLTSVGDKLFFAADGNLNTTTATGLELWVTDDTVQGTQVIDILKGTGTSKPLPGRTHLRNDAERSFAVFGYRILFIANGDLNYSGSSVSGLEVWGSDGTTQGTLPLKVAPDGWSGVLVRAYITPAGDRLFFIADNRQDGLQVFVSDGTPKGTQLASKLAVTRTRSLVAAGSRHAYFTANGQNGEELYRTDGTIAGSMEVADIHPGQYKNQPFSSNPDELVVMGGRLYFRADDGRHGRELWSFDLDASARQVGLPCSVSARPELLASDPVLDSNIILSVRGAPKGSSGILAIGLQATPLQLVGACTSYLDLAKPMLPLFFQPDAAGAWSMQTRVGRNKGLTGLIFALQAVFGPTTTPTMGLDWSNGLYLSPDTK